MSGKLVMLLGVLGIGGYVGHKAMSYDPTVYPYSREQIQKMLTDARTTLPRRDGPGQIEIWSAGRSDKGVSLKMQYASWAPELSCEAVVTEIAPDKSRVVPDCGAVGDQSSALNRTENQLRVPMFEEHIAAILNHREFNRATVDQKESAAVFSNLGGMQREALQKDAEMRRMESTGH